MEIRCEDCRKAFIFLPGHRAARMAAFRQCLEDQGWHVEATRGITQKTLIAWCPDCMKEKHMAYTPEMLDDLARVCYEANRVVFETYADEHPAPWDQLSPEDKQGSLDCVKFHLDNPRADISAYHSHWLGIKKAEGWKYGPAKDPETKEHPYFVSFEALPVKKKKEAAVTKHLVEVLG